MGLPRNLARAALPTSRLAAATWAWRNRAPLASWGRFGVRAAQQALSGHREDAIWEGRLRAALTADRLTRRAPVQVEVVDGVARLWGTVSAEVADAASAKARNIDGISKVRDDLEVPPRRRGRPS